jgi:hypothetical protein
VIERALRFVARQAAWGDADAGAATDKPPGDATSAGDR